MAGLFSLLLVPGHVAAAGDLSRVSGSDRIATAIAISQRLFVNPDSAGGVLLARSDQFPDALAAASLAGMLRAPILLNPGGSGLSSSVRGEIDRVLAAGKPVIIVGGSSALPTSIDTALKGTYSVERLGGSNRYHTARLIKERGDQVRGSSLNSVIIASGENFPDALSASSYAAFSGTPIVLVKRDSLPADASALLGQSIDSAFLIGGNAAVSDATKAAIESNIGNLVTRISGNDRYETSVRVAEFFFATPLALTLSTGTTFPDALAGGLLAGTSSLSPSGMPLLLTQTSQVPQSLSDYLLRNAATLDDTTSGYVLGGTKAVSSATETQVEQLL